MRFKMGAWRRKLVRRGETGSISVDDIPLPDTEHNLALELERRELLERLSTAISHMGIAAGRSSA